jgi:hypothetical protein
MLPIAPGRCSLDLNEPPIDDDEVRWIMRDGRRPTRGTGRFLAPIISDWAWQGGSRLIRRPEAIQAAICE